MSTMTDVSGAQSQPSLVLARLQFGLAFTYTVLLGIALGRAAYLAGRFYVPSRDDPATALIDVWPGAWRAFWSVFMPVMVLAPPLMLLLSLLAVVWTLASLRRRGPAWWWLVASTALSVAVALFMLLPSSPGQTTLIWLMD